MAVLSREDYMSRLQGVVGEDTSDESLSLIEDLTDTYNDLESKASSSDGEDWKAKYDELDAEWRKKYSARFFDGTNDDGKSNPDTNNEGEDEPDETPKTFEDLFEEEK